MEFLVVRVGLNLSTPMLAEQPLFSTGSLITGRHVRHQVVQQVLDGYLIVTIAMAIAMRLLLLAVLL